MKLYKEIIVPRGEIQPENELIAEDDNIENLRARGNSMATKDGYPEVMWLFLGDKNVQSESFAHGRRQPNCKRPDVHGGSNRIKESA